MSETKMTGQEAAEALTVGEVLTIERHYGKEFGSKAMSGVETTVGVVWALERRRAHAENAELPTWDTFNDWSMKQINGYFADDEIEIDPSQPETESGKGDSPDA